MPNPWWDDAVTRHPVASAAGLTAVGTVAVLDALEFAAGGAVEGAEAGVKVTEEGLRTVTTHLAQFGE